MRERFGVLVGIAAAAGVPVILNPSPLTSEFIQARVEVDTHFVQEFVQE